MNKTVETFFIAAFLIMGSSVYAKDAHDFYQIKIYHLKNNDQLNQVDEYLKNAYLPALHRLGIKNIGVFKPIANDTSVVKFIYVLIAFNSVEAWIKTNDDLAKDKAYNMKAKSFMKAPSDKSPYDRMESILLEAFNGQSHLLLPGKKALTSFLN